MIDLFDTEPTEKDSSLFEKAPVDDTIVDTTSSDKNLIAQASLIDGGSVGNSYSSLAALAPEERKMVIREITTQAKGKEIEGNISAMSTLIQDPNMSEEAKADLVQVVAGGSVEPYSSLTGTAEVLHTTVLGNESESQERRLATVGELIGPVVELVAEKQKAINALSYGEDGDAVSLFNNYGDLGELLAPLNEQIYANQIRDKIGSGELSTVREIFNFALLGEAKVDATEAYGRMPPEEKMKFIQASLSIMNNAKTMNIFNDNDLLQLDNFMAIVQDGYYGTTDRVLEDIGSVLDLIPIVNLVYRAAIKPVSRAAKLKTLNMFNKASVRRTASQQQPASVVSLAEQVNPEVAKSMAKTIDDDVTGEAADALAGTSRAEAQVSMHGPQIKTEDGSVVAKPYAMDKDILDAAYGETSKLFRTPNEIARVAEKTRTDLDNVNGLVRYDEGSTSHTELPNGTIDITERYITPAGGFHSPSEALKSATENLAYYGVQEKDLTVMRKVGDEYVPVTLKDVIGKDEIVRAATTGKVKPASGPELEAVENAFIQQKREELLSEVSPRLDRGSRKQLLKERLQLEESLSKVKEEPVGKPVKGKGSNARKAKKDAQAAATRLTSEERLVFQERIDLIDSKLAASKKGEEAEADLSRLEQGIVPARFKEELDQLKRDRGTVIEGTSIPRHTLPDELQKVNMQDDYAVEVNFNYSPKAVDVTRDDLKVKLNFLDQLSSQSPTPGKGSASRYAFQASYMLDPTVFQGGVAAIDQGNRLQKVIMDKANAGVYTPMKSLDDASAKRISEVMSDQNMSRKNYTKDDLADLGIVEDAELTILDNWKYINDQLWHLANRDMAKNLSQANFSMYTDIDKGDKFVGKSMPANTPLSKRPTTVYDPTSGTTRLTSETWGEVEKTGGHIFELKTPELIDDVEVSHILVRGGQVGRYVKAIQEGSNILPYVEGWSHIGYKHPFFIERVMVDNLGNEVKATRQAILTAPESTSAATAVSRLTENASNALKGRTWVYSVKNSRELDAVSIAEKKFDVATSAGLSSQRKRGQTLKSFDSSRVTDMAPKITDPLESFKHSAAELSKRVPVREYLDDLEQRILQQYKKTLPKDDFGNPRMPTAGEKLAGGDVVGTEGAKLMADAKATIEHYNYIKFGYLNNIDKGWKKVINKTSQIVGKVSRRMEKGVLALGEEVPSLVGAFKGTAFNAHIALSAPPSQWMVQGLPALMNILLHPEYVAKGMVGDMVKLTTGIVREGNEAALLKAMSNNPTKAKEILKLTEEWNRSGLGVGVDKHLMVETGLENMMDTGRFTPLKKAHDAIVDTGRKAGFDKGETFQLMAYWLAARNDAIKAGKSMDNARDFEEVRAKTRALTMNMNKAGEMPWNRDSMSLWTQFMISPYKALTMYLDRGLTGAEKQRAAAYQLLVMPLPSLATYHIRAAVGVEGSEGDLATEVITNGMLGGVFNTTANAMFEGTGSASWQRLVQFDPSFAGPLTLMSVLSEDLQGVNIIQAIAQSSPSLSMFTGYNPIAKNLAKSFGGLITAPVMGEEETLLAMKAFAGENGALWQYSALGRGMSQAYKEIFTDEAGKRYSAISGKLQDGDVSVPESIARAGFGLETTWQTVARRANMNLYDGSRDSRDDADLIIKELEREATQLGFNMDSPERAPYIIRHFALAFPNGRVPPKMAAYMIKELRPSMSLTQQLLSGHGWGVTEVDKVMQALGTDKPELKQMYEYLQSDKAVRDTQGEN